MHPVQQAPGGLRRGAPLCLLMPMAAEAHSRQASSTVCPYRAVAARQSQAMRASAACSFPPRAKQIPVPGSSDALDFLSRIRYAASKAASLRHNPGAAPKELTVTEQTSSQDAYRMPLPPATTLAVYKGRTSVFTSSGKWLHPLFELEQEMRKGTLPPAAELSLHDSAIGKAAAVLILRMGIRRIHTDLASSLAVSYIQDTNKLLPPGGQAEFSYTHLVDRLLCATEAQLAPLSDSDTMYFLLRQRAQLVCGTDVCVQNLSAPFGKIHNLSFSLKPGAHLMVLGENGAGKTTLLRMLAGITEPRSGSITIGGKQIRELPRYTIGYIPQQTDTVGVSLSTEEVAGLGIPPGPPASERKELVKSALERTSSLHLLDRSFASLSGGEKQKVSISRCLAQHARLLLLDEPTSALDEENRRMVTDILRSLTVTEIPTIITVTHDRELAALRGWEVLKLGEQD